MQDVQSRLARAMELAQRGQAQQALVEMRHVAELAPGAIQVWNNLGALEQAAGNLERARAGFERARELDPASYVPCLNLAEVQLELGQREAAVATLRCAATLAPEQALAWSRLGEALSVGQTAAQAIAPLRRALELEPGQAPVERALADALQQVGQFAEAALHYRLAIEAGAEQADVFAGLGHALLELAQPALAVEALRRCLQLFAEHDRAHYDLGKALFDLGCVEQGVEHLRLASRSPQPEVVFGSLQSLAVILPGSPRDDHAALLALRRRFAAQIPACAAARPVPRARAGSRLRVGYLSSFFHRDNWMKPVRALLEQHDRERFELHLLDDSPAGVRAIGCRPELGDRTHALRGLSNELAIEHVRALDLDLLIDLNGYSVQARLPLLRARLARRVALWFNMYATSGIEEVDFLIGDAAVVDPAEEAFYSERILRVPSCYLAYDVNYPTPPVAAPPCATRAGLCFGSLASLYKLTDAVLDCWAALMCAAPELRLFLKNAGLGELANREFLWRRFEQRAVARERIELEGGAEHFDFLRAYDKLDLALDPFPYSGGTTSSEALWQGVPVLSLRGDRWASRTSASIMRAAGLDDFVLPDLEAYARAALELASAPGTPARLAELRAGMRERLRASKLFAMPAFAREMEALYERMLADEG